MQTFHQLVFSSDISATPFSTNLALALTLVTCGISAFFILFLFDTTDVPYVRNLPSIPGLPIFGNLIQLGVEHPKRLAELSKKYGPVYQMRLGNRVCQLFSKDLYTCTDISTEIHCGQYLRCR